MRVAVAGTVASVASVALVAGCGGGPANDPAAREALIQANVRSAAEKSYVATVSAGSRPSVRYTFVAPDQLRIEQGDGKGASVMIQNKLTGYHSVPGKPSEFVTKTENVPATTNAPLNNISSLITQSEHVTRKGNVINFDVAYGRVTVHLLVELDGKGRIATAELPVFDPQRKVVAYRQATFEDYGSAPAILVPKARRSGG